MFVKELIQCIVNGAYIVNGILNIAVAIAVDPRIEDVVKCSLCTFDLGRKESFFAYIHRKKHSQVRNMARRSPKKS